MIDCTTSLPPKSGMRRQWRQNCLSKRIGLIGGSDAVLVIDDTAIPKKGMHSVGVAAQYASALGNERPGVRNDAQRPFKQLVYL
jgi:hypothetical protein